MVTVKISGQGAACAPCPLRDSDRADRGVRQRHAAVPVLEDASSSCSRCAWHQNGNGNRRNRLPRCLPGQCPWPPK